MKVQGVVRPPGDKSISHRAVMLAGLARGASELEGLLPGAEVKSTARVLRQLGAQVSSVREGGNVTVHASRISHPASRLNCGNSGTTARLMLGILAGQRFAATLTGDASLRRRPMRRVTEPLRAMGAEITEGGGDALPLTIRGGRLRALTYPTPVASAQIKSALLLAGLTGGVAVTIREPYRSRDHTERLLARLGLGLHERDGAIVYEPPPAPEARSLLRAFRLAVPGDASSAAFLVGAAALAQGGELVIENVGVNPTRTGFLVVLARMGAHVDRVNLRDAGGEPVADLVARPGGEGGALRGTEVSAAEVPTLVDEVPMRGVLASGGEGETVFREVGELRVKESNRLELIAANLRALGVEAEARGNDLHVCGTTRPPRGRVDTARDHRLAMAFAVLGTVPGADVRLSERASVAISYPRFFADLRVRLVLVDDGFRPAVAGVDVDEAIRSERVTRHVSAIAAIREVRNWVNVQQRDAVAGVARGVVVDGRDIGTVVFPDAPVKVFLTASPEERARRRLAQRGSRIDPAELAREAQALAARDRADSTRPVAPLRAAADAVLLDTTDRVVALARERHLG